MKIVIILKVNKVNKTKMNSVYFDKKIRFFSVIQGVFRGFEVYCASRFSSYRENDNYKFITFLILGKR